MREPSSWVERVAQRVNMFIAATLYREGSSDPVRIRNLSTWGAMLDANFEPLLGSRVSISRGRLSAIGEVVWTGSGRFGVSFAHPAVVENWLAPAKNSGQSLADKVFLRVVNHSEPSAFEALASRTVSADWIGSGGVDEVVHLLSELENELSDDLVVVAQHGHILQNLDRALQILQRMKQSGEFGV